MIDMEDGQETAEKFRELCELCKSPAQEIKKKTNLLVVSHVDADGLTAAAIVCTALERCDLDFKSLFFRQLDGPALDKVADHCADLVIFTDLGSGMIQQICDRSISAVVADHHKPAACEARSIAHINPHLVGADGATHLSGSGTSFLLARALASSPGNNDDLAALAVVGAVRGPAGYGMRSSCRHQSPYPRYRITGRDRFLLPRHQVLRQADPSRL